MDAKDLLDLGAAAWTIVRILGPYVWQYAPGLLGSA